MDRTTPPMEPPLERVIPRVRPTLETITYERASNPWMLTFADLLSLILVFFILIYASATINVQKLRGLSNALTERLHLQPKDILTYDAQAQSNALQDDEALPLDYLHTILRNKLAHVPSLAALDLVRTRDAVLIRLPEEGWFAPGTNQPTPLAKQNTLLLAETLNSLGNAVQIIGYPGEALLNEEDQRMLGLKRAITIAALMQTKGYSAQVEILGKVDDTTAEEPSNNDGLTRSIEIIMMPEQVGYHGL
jgi:chemotaxis protein MotB